MNPFFLFLAVSAATTSASDQQPPAAISLGTCNAAPAQRLVGQADGPKIRRKAIKLSGAQIFRILRQNSIMTQDYGFDRLNIVIGPKGKISDIHCG